MGTKNCWEHIRCGREPGGRNVRSLGVCPVSTETRLDGLNRGTNGGRACWAVPPDLVFGSEVKAPQGVSRHHNCLRCPFFQCVKSEEGESFAFISEIFDRLRRPVRLPRWS